MTEDNLNNGTEETRGGEEQNGGQEQNGSCGGPDFGKIFKAGIGAFASAINKGASYVEELTTEGTETNKRAAKAVDDLAQKGEEALKQTCNLGCEMKNQLRDAVNRIPVNAEIILNNLRQLSDEQIAAVRQKLDEIQAERAKAPEEETEQPAEDGDDQNPNPEA